MSDEAHEQQLRETALSLAETIHKTMPYLNYGDALERSLAAAYVGHLTHYGPGAADDVITAGLMFMNILFASVKSVAGDDMEETFRAKAAEVILFGPRNTPTSVTGKTTPKVEKS